MESDETRPIFIPPGAGTALDFLAVTHKLTSAQTGRVQNLAVVPGCQPFSGLDPHR